MSWTQERLALARQPARQRRAPESPEQMIPRVVMLMTIRQLLTMAEVQVVQNSATLATTRLFGRRERPA